MDNNVKYFLVGVITVVLLVLIVPVSINILEQQNQEKFRKDVRELFVTVNTYYKQTGETSGTIQALNAKEKDLEGSWVIENEQIILKNIHNKNYIVKELRELQKDTTFELVKIDEKTQVPDDTPTPPVEDPPVEQNKTYLVDVVQVGDYVAYDAGTWTGNEPTGSFGQYEIGSSKNHSQTCDGSINQNSGWRVLSKSGSGATGIVTLVHAGTPECYQHDQSEISISNLNDRAANYYLNATYASNARNINCADIQTYQPNACIFDIATVEEDIFNAGSTYWFADMHGDAPMWLMSENNVTSAATRSSGIRPVIELKTGILQIDGTGSPENAYQISIE